MAYSHSGSAPRRGQHQRESRETAAVFADLAGSESGAVRRTDWLDSVASGFPLGRDLFYLHNVPGFCTL